MITGRTASVRSGVAGRCEAALVMQGHGGVLVDGTDDQ